MSRPEGFIDPETRCYVETVTAAARPGRHRPDATVTQTADERSGAQRCHDGIKLGLKAGIASGALGTPRGHPVTVIVRTTLAEPNQAAHAATDADCLFFACAPDHKLITDGHYQTQVTDTARLAWTDATTPPDITRTHHPEELLRGDTDPPHDDEE
jgi:hypothetical protein